MPKLGMNFIYGELPKSSTDALEANRDARRAYMNGHRDQTTGVEEMKQPMLVKKGESIGAALSQEEIDRYVELSKAYLGGPNIPFEIQLLAYEKYDEAPSGIEIDHDALDGLSVVDFLREIIPLRDRKIEFGVQDGVEDPEALLATKQRAVIIYTRCALTIAESEVVHENAKQRLAALYEQDEIPVTERAELQQIVDNPPDVPMVYFPAPDGASLGRNGYIHLFPGYPDSPAGLFRGDGAAFNAQECIDFISKHFSDVEDEILGQLADA